MLTDDDRKLLRIAYDEAKAGFDEGGCPIGSVLARGGKVVWAAPKLVQGNIGTPMFCVPRGAAGVWTERYEGDFDFVRDSHRRMNDQDCLVWHEDILVDCG